MNIYLTFIVNWIELWTELLRKILWNAQNCYVYKCLKLILKRECVPLSIYDMFQNPISAVVSFVIYICVCGWGTSKCYRIFLFMNSWHLLLFFLYCLFSLMWKDNQVNIISFPCLFQYCGWGPNYLTTHVRVPACVLACLCVHVCVCACVELKVLFHCGATRLNLCAWITMWSLHRNC